MGTLTNLGRALVLGGLTGIAVYVIADTARLWVEGPVVPASSNGESPRRSIPTLPASDHPLTGKNIKAWRLFGVEEADTGIASVSAPETRLKLKLLGLFNNNSSGQGWAIVQSDKGASKLYRVGEKVNSDASIKAIASNYVLLEREGALERLSLLAWDEIAGVKTVLGKDKEGGKRNNQEESRSIEGPRGRLLTGFGLEPIQPGAARGYRVVNEDGSLADKYGFEKGDMILSANGYPLGTIDDDQMAYTSIRQSGVGNIVVRRGATEFMLEYDARKNNLKGLEALAK